MWDRPTLPLRDTGCRPAPGYPPGSDRALPVTVGGLRRLGLGRPGVGAPRRMGLSSPKSIPHATSGKPTDTERAKLVSQSVLRVRAFPRRTHHAGFPTSASRPPTLRLWIPRGGEGHRTKRTGPDPCGTLLSTSASRRGRSRVLLQPLLQGGLCSRPRRCGLCWGCGTGHVVELHRGPEPRLHAWVVTYEGAKGRMERGTVSRASSPRSTQRSTYSKRSLFRILHGHSRGGSRGRTLNRRHAG